MTLRAHATQATIGSIFLIPFLGKDTIIFFVSLVFIDIDHYFDYIFVCRRFDIRGMFKFHDFVCASRESVYGISIFHTIEVFLVLFFLGFWNYYFWIILFGFLVHFVFDLYALYINNALFSRAFSIVEYIFRRKNVKGYPVLPDGFWERCRQDM